MKKFPDASIDCETLALGTNPALLSIGVQMFNRDTGKLGPTFYHEIDPNSAVKSGQVWGSTLAWWMEQEAAARRLFTPSKEKLPLATALCALVNFLRDEGDHNVRVWANGPCADITWIESAFERGSVGLGVPWSYKNVRCYRTLVDTAEAKGFDINKVMFTGVRHNALADATYQAHVMMAAWRVLVGKAVVKPVTVDDDEL